MWSKLKKYPYTVRVMMATVALGMVYKTMGGNWNTKEKLNQLFEFLQDLINSLKDMNLISEATFLRAG
jgi:hypothetical protein